MNVKQDIAAHTRGRRWGGVAVAAIAFSLAGGALWGQATRPAESAGRAGDTEQTPTTMPSQTELIRALREERQVNVPIPSSTPADAPGGAVSDSTLTPAETSLSAQLLPEGTFVVDRPGRLVREDEWWTLVFESADGSVRERPLLLLPNQQVELMEQTSAAGTRSVVFIVSGEVTSYHGRNYLMVRKVLLRRETGNLRQ
jgi:hypothetical protein